ncbi:hypothetical protein HOA55_05245 [archaeon]|jgi:hypothetical protein|nr:hypothetical protein [archaeon]MBT3577727.1 hypothetical protein [archaeon]MBT6820734.1 hypothetical protein [archaeon]MBT6955894.1 hypothetical protein [archaeon]MBT7025874.1 hypothetical protein [archaeon]
MIEIIDPLMQMGDSLLLFVEQSLRGLHQIPLSALDAYDPDPGSTTGTSIGKVARQSAKGLVNRVLWPIKKVTHIASQPIKYVTHPIADLIGAVRKNTTSQQEKHYPQTTSELEKFTDKYF